MSQRSNGRLSDMKTPVRIRAPSRLKSVLAVLATALLLSAGAALAALSAALQSEPSVALRSELTDADVAHAIGLLRTHDPRRADPGRLTMAIVGERDLDVLLNHAARRWLDATTRIELQNGAALVQTSLHMPPNPFGRWLNVEARVVQTAGLPAIESFRAGTLPLPPWLTGRALLRLAAEAGALAELRLAAEVVHSVYFAPQQLQVTYAWQGDSRARLVAALVPAAEHERLHAHADRLVQLAGQVTEPQAAEGAVSLADLIGPLFALAAERSAAQSDAGAAAENRAALLVLTLYANGRPLASLVPAASAWTEPRKLQVLLAGRDDFPRHLLISAALAAEGSGPLSKAIGIYKEVADSRSGSGFSFNDMAANLAGTRLGELAVQEPRRLQRALSRAHSESDFMPHAADLPEFMAEAEFKRRYGGVGAAPYVAMMAEIERRVDRLAALR